MKGAVCDKNIAYFYISNFHSMKHISILVPNGKSVLSSIIGPYKIFMQVNAFMEQAGQAAPFKIQFVGISKETELYDGVFCIRPHVLLKDVKQTDLIIIPALLGNLPAELENNSAYVPWIVKQYNQGAEVASLCVGAFLLAATGLLNGRQCATHWLVADEFRKMFPDVELVADKVITDEQGIYSSGGAFSFLNLILYLVEKYCGREMAILCGKVFEIEVDRYNQSQFIIFKGQKDHEDEPVKQAQLFIENNFQDKISVEQLATMFALSRRNLERRFKKATSNTPVEYIQRVKVEAAKKKLESSREHINEVMYNVGYTDSKAFRETFKKITGLSPVAYRNRYNREMATFNYSV
jgi:transcriptional regulator GlxA family with amidase domain